MKYTVEFEEKATVKRVVQCEVEANFQKEIELKVKSGDYVFIDSWDDEDISNEFIEITSIEKADETD